MTGRTIAQMRQADLQKIHIAKKQLGLSEDDYRAAVLSVSKGKTDSAGELDMQGRAALLAHFKRSGFKVRHARKDNAGKRRTPSRPVADRSEQVKMMRALWLRLHESGAVENADEQGLVTFAEKYTQKKSTRMAEYRRLPKMHRDSEKVARACAYPTISYGLV